MIVLRLLIWRQRRLTALDLAQVVELREDALPVPLDGRQRYVRFFWQDLLAMLNCERRLVYNLFHMGVS